MSQIKIESFSDQQLIKRKKSVLFIIGLTYGICLVCLVLLIVQMTSSEQKSITGLIPGILLPVIALPMYKGLRNINEELKKRLDK